MRNGEINSSYVFGWLAACGVGKAKIITPAQ